MRTRNVYILDDEPELVELLADVVELVNLEAHPFLSARDFFSAVSVFEPHSILVLDLHMPEMDGIEVMRRLAQIPNPPALVLITGYDKGVLHAAEKLGKAHHLEIVASLAKPIQIEEFQDILLSHLPQKESDATKASASLSDDNAMQHELQTALEQGQLYLDYQPQFDAKTRKLMGAEALVRWQHPRKGILPPSVFIPYAEESGLIKEITHYVIDAAVRQEQSWQTEGLALNISVNVSGVDITSLTLPEQLTSLLATNQMDPTKLTLEITESALMGELVTSLDILTRLRLKGIGLSIDDFGTGYSSLSQLHRIPFTELKIDRSFIFNLTHDDEARAIVKTCVMLGHELNMQVVAEGVESTKQLEYLQSLSCDIVQGFYLSKPVSAEEMTRLLRENQAS